MAATATGYQLLPGSWIDVIALHQLLEQARELPLAERAPLLLEEPAFNGTQLPEVSVDQPFSDWAGALHELVRTDLVSLQILGPAEPPAIAVQEIRSGNLPVPLSSFVELALLSDGAHVGLALLEGFGLKDQVPALPFSPASGWTKPPFPPSSDLW